MIEIANSFQDLESLKSPVSALGNRAEAGASLAADEDEARQVSASGVSSLSCGGGDADRAQVTMTAQKAYRASSTLPSFRAVPTCGYSAGDILVQATRYRAAFPGRHNGPMPPHIGMPPSKGPFSYRFGCSWRFMKQIFANDKTRIFRPRSL